MTENESWAYRLPICIWIRSKNENNIVAGVLILDDPFSEISEIYKSLHYGFDTAVQQPVILLA